MRVVAAFLPASLITLALFCLMQYLITGGRQPPVRADYPGFVDLVRLHPEAEQQETTARTHTLARHRQAPDDTPPAPQPPSTDVQAPELPPLSIDRPQPDPLQIATAPYLGAFAKSTDAGTLATAMTLNNPLAQAALPNPEPGEASAPSAAVDLTADPGGIGGDGGVLPLLRIEPAYPRKAARDGKENWVKVEFTISERDTVINPVMVKSRPHRVFNRSALSAIRKWRFKPRLVAGKPVASRATQLIEFSLAGR